jgi:hypothetical protein
LAKVIITVDGSEILRQSRLGDEVTRSAFLKVGFLILALAIASGCAATSPAPQPQPPRPANRYIYISSQSLPGECYTDLGTVKLARPFGEAAVDPDNSGMQKELRAAALSKYPADVDAVINVQSQQNDAGTDVIVTGEAVRLEDRTTVRCALRGAESALDQSAKVGAGGVAGTTMGGLTGGAGGAASVGVAGAAMMGAYEVIQHEQLKQQQAAELKKSLDDQRREISQLLKERSRLQECRNDDVPLSACMASTQSAGQSSPDQSVSEGGDRNAVGASPFEIKRQIQEQQDYIKQLKGQIAEMKWQMSGH